MYVCMQACTHVCMHAYMYVCMYMHIYTYTTFYLFIFLIHLYGCYSCSASGSSFRLRFQRCLCSSEYLLVLGSLLGGFPACYNSWLQRRLAACVEDLGGPQAASSITAFPGHVLGPLGLDFGLPCLTLGS